MPEAISFGIASVAKFTLSEANVLPRNDDYVYFLTIKVALCPPKPSAFDAATFIL